jgi:hypothetical protein
MKICCLETKGAALVKVFKDIIAKINPAFFTGTLNSVDGAVQLLDKATPVFEWKKLFGGWKAALFIIFFNLVILLFELATTKLTMTGFFKKLGACILSTYASQISGNAVRELC